MLRGRSIKPGLAFLVLALCLAAFGARAAEKQVGLSCSSDQNSADWDTIAQCSSGTYVRGPYFFGASSDTCDGTHEGLTRYDSTAHLLYYCDGSAWVTINGNAAPTPGCGQTGTLSTQLSTTVNRSAG